MNSSLPCQIEVLFGSKNRADFDALSDVDYLLADPDADRLKDRKQTLEAFGFSVSDYSMKRLQALFRKKTLFAVHLKLEGKVIFDQLGEFCELANGLDQIRSYRPEQIQSFELFSPLQNIPDTPRGVMWALDHAAVAFRNAAIVDHARRGEFVFSHEELLLNYQNWGEATQDELCALSELRRAKRAYRSGHVLPKGREILDGSLRAIDEIFSLGLGAEFHTRPIIARVSGAKDSTKAYASLREIEKELIAVRTERLDGFQLLKLDRLFRTVRNPHSYLWRAMHDHISIDRALDDLRASIY